MLLILHKKFKITLAYLVLYQELTLKAFYIMFISSDIAVMWMPQDFIDAKSTLVQVMVWHPQATLLESMLLTMFYEAILCH